MTIEDDPAGHLLDMLRSDPRTLDLPDLQAIADVVAPYLREAVATELSMAADEISMGDVDPEQFLRQRAREVGPQRPGGRR